MNSITHLRAQMMLRKMLRINARPRVVMPRQLPPDTVILSYAKDLEGVLRPALELIEREVLPLAKQELSRRDADWNALLDDISEKFFKSLSVSSLISMIRESALRTSSWQRAQLRSQVSAALGVDLPLADALLGPRLDAFVKENLALIKSVPNRFIDDVEREVVGAVRRGVRYADLAETIEARFGVAKREALRLAKDQTLKLYADLNQVRQEDLGLTKYIWRTMSDGRTRPAHQRREGKSFSWTSSPPGGAPGQAVGCRCYAEPDLTPLLEAA